MSRCGTATDSKDEHQRLQDKKGFSPPQQNSWVDKRLRGSGKARCLGDSAASPWPPRAAVSDLRLVGEGRPVLLPGPGSVLPRFSRLLRAPGLGTPEPCLKNPPTDSAEEPLVLMSSVDEQGNIEPWCLNACGEGASLHGLPSVELNGCIETVFTKTTTFDPVTDSRRETPWTMGGLVLSTSTKGEQYLLTIWGGTRFIDNDRNSKPEQRYTVRGYLSNRKPGGPWWSAAEKEIVVCAMERIE